MDREHANYLAQVSFLLENFYHLLNLWLKKVSKDKELPFIFAIYSLLDK